MKTKNVKASIKSDDEIFNEIKDVVGKIERKDGREKTTPVVNYDKIMLEIPV